jgi:hypothetical protein
LKLTLLKQPPGLKQLIWEPEEVNYLIRKWKSLVLQEESAVGNLHF